MLGSDSDDSDYIVEKYIKPGKITARLVNNAENDLLGNFDDSPVKKKKKVENLEEESDDDDDDGNKDGIIEERNYDDDETDEDDEIIYKKIEIISETEDDYDNSKTTETKGKINTGEQIDDLKDFSLSENQLKKLQNGISKSNRFVLYVTNLTADTTKEQLHELFVNSGNVKSIRIPKIRKSNYAFIEMKDEISFKNAFNLHNKLLNGKQIKIQMSEAGKKKSANKKNIMKQKNRCLAEMRNESKTFLKSGKSFSLTNSGKKRIKERATLNNKNKKK